MIQAYNYMLESYPIKREVMYPAHKRSELKKVYNSIVNLSKRSPLYKIDLSKDNQEYTFGIKETALSLKAKLIGMEDPVNSGFQTKAVSISDERILSANLISENTEGLPEVISFQVNQVAKPQINRGKELMQGSKGLVPGTYQFQAKVLDETYDLTYVHPERMENKEVQKKLVELLNQNVKGITATLEKGSSSDYYRIAIVSEQAGRNGESAFSFHDSDDYFAGLVDYFGLDRVEAPSESAQFELNGISKHTSTNTFHLENKLRVTLHNGAQQPVILKIVPDSNKVLSAVETVLETYNYLIQIAKNRTVENKDHYRASKLLGEMKSLENMYQEELEASGLKIKEDGTITLNDSLAIQAAQDGGMESLFTRENGFIARLLDKAETIAINPMEYLDKTVVTYPNSEGNMYRNPYVTSMYSGLFFNSYC